MQVYKFGGASVKDAAAIKNVAQIVSSIQEPLCVVVSAMGKTTNALEKLHFQWFHGQAFEETLQFITDFHQAISAALELETNTCLWHQQIESLRRKLGNIDKDSFDASYDQIIPFGEIISTSLLHDYWNKIALNHQFVMATDFVITDNLHRESRVQWEATQKKIIGLKNNADILLTQGFIGSTTKGEWTTLGREGSDYSASIFAHCLDANQLTIWKDVPGMLNADPKKQSDAQIIEKISYQEAIELAYYGASVIHPKTIQPLESKNIELRIASFVNPNLPGTLIGNFPGLQYPSCYIEKENQTLISISTKDFSFVVEDNIVEIFNQLHLLGIKVQMMENSALSFTMCIQCEPHKLNALITSLEHKYTIRYNEGVKLLTIRHYQTSDLLRMAQQSVLMEQKNRTTVRWVIQ
jgi:aspartate kinase